jgi:exosortase A
VDSAAEIETRKELEARVLPAAAVAAALTAAILLLYPTARALVGTWYTSSTYGHGFLIVPISLYFVWRQRHALAALTPQPAWSGLVLLSLAALGWLIGEVTNTLIARELCLVAVLQAIVLTMLGWSMCRALAFPLLYLYFAVPFGESLIPPLQSVTADLAVALLRLGNVPVFADGNVISVPSGDFYVAEACSGIHYLIASVVLATMFAAIAYRSWWRRAVFLAVSVAVPILANGLRAFGVILLAQFAGNTVAGGIDHVVGGWIFFSLVTVLILAIGARFREAPAPDRLPLPPSRPADERARTLPRVLAAGLIALLPVIAVRLYGARANAAPTADFIHPAPPTAIGPWRRVDGPADPAPPAFAGADAEIDATYALGESRAYLHIGYFRSSRPGARVVSSDHVLVGKDGWISAAAGAPTAAIDAAPVTLQSLRMVRGHLGHVVWYWYWVDGRFTGSPYVAKLLEASAKLLGGEPRAAIIAVGADYADAPAEAEGILRRFVDGRQDWSAYLRGASAP